MSAAIPYLRSVNTIVILVCADPLDPDDTLLIVDGGHKAVVVALNIEHNTLSRDDARGRIETLDICGVSPSSSADLVEPSVDCRFQGRLLLASGLLPDEFAQAPPGND